MRAFTPAILITLAACAPAPCEQKYGYYVQTSPAYAFEPVTTESGILIDPSSNAIDFDYLEASVQEARECLATQGHTLGQVRVKVPDDWGMNDDGTEEVLPFATRDRACKGKQATEAAPCRFRAIVQCATNGAPCEPIAVVTPNMKLLKDALTRIATGSTNPWEDPTLAPCAMPHARVDPGAL